MCVPYHFSFYCQKFTSECEMKVLIKWYIVRDNSILVWSFGSLYSPYKASFPEKRTLTKKIFFLNRNAHHRQFFGSIIHKLTFYTNRFVRFLSSFTHWHIIYTLIVCKLNFNDLQNLSPKRERKFCFVGIFDMPNKPFTLSWKRLFHWKNIPQCSMCLLN